MVKEINNLFKCEECGFKFRDKDTASKCEQFCKKYKSCNTELIKEAVE